jgi:hypothetical protein
MLIVDWLGFIAVCLYLLRLSKADVDAYELSVRYLFRLSFDFLDGMRICVLEEAFTVDFYIFCKFSALCNEFYLDLPPMFAAKTIVGLFEARVVAGRKLDVPEAKLIVVIAGVGFLSDVWKDETIELLPVTYVVFVFLLPFFFFEAYFFVVPDKNELHPVIYDFLFSLPIEFMYPAFLTV